VFFASENKSRIGAPRNFNQQNIQTFIALPGKQADLYKEREMENAYLKHLGRPENLI